MLTPPPELEPFRVSAAWKTQTQLQSRGRKKAMGWRGVAVAIAIALVSSAMRVDPGRIAARLRIEREEQLEREARSGVRSRRQLATPKEISIQVTAPLFSSRLFEYGKAAGDAQLPAALDEGVKLSLKNPVSFFGKSTNDIFILANGGIGFEPSANAYKANLFHGGSRMIATFWNRNDLRNGGNVWYREVTSGRVLERGQSEIRYQYDKSVKVKSAILVTWENMQPVGANPLPQDNTNTFQAALFVTDSGTFANFIYSNIGWTQGAEAGFNKAEGTTTHYALPTSGTGNIMYLEEYGNTGIPGEWMFEFGKDSIIRCKPGIKGDTCDSECAAGEWGADCARCCHCSGVHSCNSLTGDCPSGCSDCWMGPGCATKKDSCGGSGANATCAVNALSFTDTDKCGEPLRRCHCMEGFTGDGHKKCNDIDECAKPGVCHANAVCNNTPGRYFCQCKEGFSGDGVKECSSAFLLPSSSHQALPGARSSKIAWRLRAPQKWFGQDVNQLTITSTGLVSLDDANTNGLRLLQMPSVRAVAALYSSQTDTASGGQVTVAESTDSDVLTKVTRTLREATGDSSFMATSALIVTSTNVSNGDPARNTHQTIIVPGVNGRRESSTFAILMYQSLGWTEGAEAAVLPGQPSSAILLPGSGTEAVRELTRLSNVRQPGVWLFRIDRATIPPCPRDNLLPPYCEDELLRADVARPPEDEEGEGKAVDFSPISITPQIVNATPARRLQQKPLQPFAASTVEATTPPPTTPVPSPSPRTASRPLPVFKSTPHKPLISLSDEDIEDIPPDAFEITLPSFVTVIPEIFTQKSGEPKTTTKKALPEFEKPSTTPLPSTTTSATTTTTRTTPHLITHAAPEDIVEEPKRERKTEAVPGVVDVSEDHDDDLAAGIPVAGVGGHESSAAQEEPLPAIAIDDESVDTEEAEGTPPPIFVFTTTTHKPAPPKTTPHTNIVTAPKKMDKPPTTTPKTMFNAEADTATSSLAIIIPSSIVMVWIGLLVVIACVVWCRRRDAAKRLRNSYGPAYAVRGGGYGLKRGVAAPGYPDGSYEDHLEKAARLSSEMTSYNQTGRVSLYGSYWNLSNVSPTTNQTTTLGGSGGAPNGRPPALPYTNPAYTGTSQRYTYTGRY